MEKRTDLYGKGDHDGISALEKELLAQNADHKDWECTEKLMAVTHEADALYMHCLPADITGVSCAEGEVAAGVFDRYRVPMYMEAGYKPYIIAAMIFLSKTRNPADKLGLNANNELNRLNKLKKRRKSHDQESIGSINFSGNPAGFGACAAGRLQGDKVGPFEPSNPLRCRHRGGCRCI
jgi:hypothetical protein